MRRCDNSSKKKMLHEIFNNVPNLENEFRTNCKQKYPATEIAYIMRFLNGEKDLKCEFSDDNLEMIKMLDYYNDFYINIKPTLDSCYLDNYQLYNYNDIVKKLYYKPAHLLDVMNTKFIRTQKIKNLNKISNGI